MKSSLRWCVVPLLGATLFAQTAAKPKAKKAAAPKAPPVTAADVQALKDALAAQQQQIEQLRQSLQQRDQAVQSAQQQAAAAQQSANDANAKAAALAGAAGAADKADKAAVDKLSSDLTDVKTTMQNELLTAQDEQKRVSALEGAFGRFRFNGDVRIRGESFFQQGLEDRNRVRIRVRFGFEGRLNEDFVGGISLASGTLGDPTTTNETLTNNFDRKTVAIDRAYITWNPSFFKHLIVTAGKWQYTWQRTSMTFDPDLNPEGFSEKLNFDLHNKVFKNVNVQSVQLLYNESFNAIPGAGGLYKGRDSYAIGGSVSGRLALGIWSLTPSYTILNWRYQDAILNSSAFAVAANNAGILGNPTLTPPTPNVGAIPVPGEGPGCQNPSSGGVSPVSLNVPTSNGCVFAPNGMTNSTWVDFTTPTAPKWHFLSTFLYSDVILNNQFKTPWARLPINILLEFEENLNAADHPFDVKTGKSGCAADSTGAIVCTKAPPPVSTSLGKQNQAYLIDASIGQQKNRGDVQVGYAWEKVQQDAMIASFVESDQRAPTNILQNRFYALWKVRSNTVAGFTYWWGRILNSNLLNAGNGPTGVPPGFSLGNSATEPWLKRLQFDLIYTF